MEGYMMVDDEVEEILEVFIRYYGEVGLIDAVVNAGIIPPIPLSRFMEIVGIGERELIDTLYSLWEKGVIRMMDVWVQPGHRIITKLPHRLREKHGWFRHESNSY